MNFKSIIAIILKKARFSKISNSNIDKTSKIYSGCSLTNVNVGKYTYVSYDNTIAHTEIGNFCSIASGSIIGGANHPIEWISTSPVFHEGKNPLNVNFSEHKFNPYTKTIIENDVWIGSKCLIKAGVKISNGAIIGMGSVVTKNIGPYEIWAGNPAKFIRKRFSEEQISKIIKLNWWNKNEDELKVFSKNVNSISELK